MNRQIIMAGVLALTVLGLVGCEQTISKTEQAEAGAQEPEAERFDDLIGKNGKVQFKRDMLGASADLPIPPMTDGINGASVSISGKFVHISDQWVVLESQQVQTWVPRENVLLFYAYQP